MNPKFKKFSQITILFLCIISLSGCLSFGGTSKSNDKVTADERSKIYENSEFKVKIPREWDIIEKKDFTNEVPEETQAVFRNNVKNWDFTANVNIVRNTLQNPKETLQYAKEVMNRQKTGLYDYKELKTDLVRIKIGDKEVDTYYVEFEARKDASDDITKFFQTFGVKGNNGYIIMGAASLKENTNVMNTVSEIVKSFSVK